VKKWIFLILILVLLLGNFNFALAQQKIEINFFFSAICPHCVQEKKFLEELEKKYPEIEIKKLGLSERKNVDLLKVLYRDYKVPSEIQGYVPITFIGERYFLGFSENIGQDIENYILRLIQKVPPEEQPSEEQLPPEWPSEEIVAPLEKRVKLPILGVAAT